MSVGGPLREDEHLHRSARDRKIGDALSLAGDEWAAVPWFYSAYHMMKAALLVDPIWTDLRALTAISVDLAPAQRFTDRHKGRIRRWTNQPREWGINELVLKLYTPAASHYERLHQASISVRYGTGLPAGALPALDTALRSLLEMQERGGLEAPLRW